MRLGIIGAIALGLGILAMVYCRWFIIEIIEGLVEAVPAEAYKPKFSYCYF